MLGSPPSCDTSIPANGITHVCSKSVNKPEVSGIDPHGINTPQNYYQTIDDTQPITAYSFQLAHGVSVSCSLSTGNKGLTPPGTCIQPRMPSRQTRQENQ